MSDLNRRELLKGILGKLAQATGTVVVASAALSLPGVQGQPPVAGEQPVDDLLDRADRLSASHPAPSPEAEDACNTFLNGGFRNTPLGAFRNTPLGGFRNTPLGNFRNTPVGGFRNTPLGSSFANGGWPNGTMSGFRNGGWPNMGWHNWW
ncbi:MAG: hypothetical protein JNM56_25930 [Planctomycetia bacterium]|nr:hypothetical protein [Planctomycetia bacterium]